MISGLMIHEKLVDIVVKAQKKIFDPMVDIECHSLISITATFYLIFFSTWIVVTATADLIYIEQFNSSKSLQTDVVTK